MDRSTNEVFILGAGFSRALSGHLPLTNELGEECLRRLAGGVSVNLPADRFLTLSFERWLSRLAESQPYQSSAENLANQSLFQRFSETIAQVLNERQDLALEQAWPEWLPVFIRLAHLSRATVITLNYDTLLECAVAAGFLDMPDLSEPVFWGELTGDVPPWPPGAAHWGAVEAETLRLLKLHGSLNWYWVPGDVTGATIARRNLPGAYGDSKPYKEEDRRRHLPGRSPFIVPPSSSKSHFYANPIVREIWSQTAEALQLADNVTLIGYSLPETDIMIGNLIATTMAATTTPITVVDFEPQPVIERLASLGVGAERIVALTGERSSRVSRCIEQWENRVASAAIASLHDRAVVHATEPLLVSWGSESWAHVKSLTFEGDKAVLGVGGLGPKGAATLPEDRQRAQEEEAALPRLGDLIANSPTEVVISVADKSQRVVGVSATSHLIGLGNGEWTVLVPAGVV